MIQYVSFLLIQKKPKLGFPNSGFMQHLLLFIANQQKFSDN